MTIKHTKTEGIEPYLIETICLRLKEKEALSYLEDRGYSISRAQYYTLKDKVKQGAHTRLNHIASEGFMTQHIERIENLKAIENELWNNYHVEKNALNKCKILMMISEMQQFLAAFYDSTQWIMQQGARIKKQQETPDRENKNKEVNHS